MRKDQSSSAVEHYSLAVIVPNYNDGKYLAQCIESVVSQDVPPDELIVLDDASIDDSVEIITKAIEGYPFARLIRNPENLGWGGTPNANKGLQLATSKFILFLGANDFILPGMLRKLKERFQAHPEAGLFSAMVWQVDEDGRYLRLHPSPVLALREVYLPPARCRQILTTRGSWLTGQTTAYRREALLAAGGFSPSLMGLCDLLAAQVVASRHGAVYVPAPLAVMRIHGGAFLVSTVSDYRGLEAILEEISERGPKEEPELFCSAMLERTRLRFGFASLRLSEGRTLHDVIGAVGQWRKFGLALAARMAARFPAFRTGVYFLVMRPFDVLPSIWYRFLGSRVILLREGFAGRIPRSNEC